MSPKVLPFAPPVPTPVIPEALPSLGQITDDLQIIVMLRPETLHIVAVITKHLADPVRAALKRGPMH